MSLEKTTMERLAFIKYLYNLAVEQSQKPEPLCSASLLTFHDSIEMFLYLTAEYLDVGIDELDKKSNRVTFMDYWEIITKSKIKLNIELTQKESMRRLNGARNNFKHQGMIFSKLDIEAYRASATNFFSENTPLVFDIEFAVLSLIDLIQFDNARNTLKEAQRLLNENKIEDALCKISEAFDQLISDYESTKRRIFGKDLFPFGRSSTFLRGSDILIKGNLKTTDILFNQQKFQNFVDSVSESMTLIQQALKLISLGIDYRKYTKFCLYMPITKKSISGKYYHYSRNWGSRSIPNAQDAQFCIDFVIESAIILQEFDYAIEH